MNRWLVAVAVLWVASSAVLYAAVQDGREAQERRLEQLSREVSALRDEVRALRSPPPVESPGPRGPRGTPPPSTGLSSEEVEALAARLATLLQGQGARAAQPAAAPEKPAPLSARQQEALARATSEVERVLASGRMTREDVLRIREELGLLAGRPEVTGLRLRLVVAVNQQRLTPPEGSHDRLP